MTARVSATSPAVKIHLILNVVYTLCATPRHDGDRLAVTTRGVFKTLLDDERCERCAAALRRLEDSKWNATVEP